MRVPVPIVILVAVGMTSVIWWQGTRHYDFLTPPSEERLKEVRREAALAYAPTTPADTPEPPQSGKSQVSEESAPEPPKEPPLDLGNLETAPGINAYVGDARQGAEHLIKVAKELEARGAFQRALLAWERVIDLGKPTPEVYSEALASVKRLRPTLPLWNIDPEGSLPVVLHAACGPDAAAVLKPVLEAVSRDLGTASSGVVILTPEITVGKKVPNTTAPAPIALWISGNGKDAPTTDVISFTMAKPEALREQLLVTGYGLIAGQLKRSTAYAQLPTLSQGEDALDALGHRITRLCWRDLAVALNLTQKPTPPATPTPVRTTTPEAAKPKRAQR